MTDPPVLSAESVQALVVALYPKVMRFVRSKVPDPDCYDVVQETMKVCLTLDSSRVRNPPAFLLGVARKQVYKYYERRRPSAPFDSGRVSIAELGTGPGTRLDRKNLLMHALRSLPADHQVAFELRYGEELTLEEVAETLEVSLATAKRYIAAAKGKLAEILGAGRGEIDEGEASRIAEAYREG